MLRAITYLLLLFCLAACSRFPFFGDKDENEKNAVEPVQKPTVEVTVVGVEDTLANNIRAHVGVTKNYCTIPLNLLKRRNNKTRTEAIQALQAYGYYESQLTIDYIDAPVCPRIEIKVEPGRRISINSVEFVISDPAANDPEFTKQLNSLPVQEGKELNHDDYKKTKSLVESIAAELGYLDGRFTESRLSIDIENYQANIFLQYESGERYLLGKVTIKQEPEFLDEELIERFIEIPRGSDYNVDQIIDIQNRLLASNYFKSVEARPHLSESQDKTIPVDVQVYASDRHQFQASIGFATDEGVRSRLGYKNRWWNEKGHRLGIESKLSQAEQGISGNYQIPREHPADEWLQFNAGFRQQDIDAYETISAVLGVSETKRRFWGIMENHFIAISRDDFEIGNESGLARFLIPGVNWTKRSLDDVLYPKHGFALELEVRGASDSIISDTSFITGIFNAQYLRALPFDFRTILRGNLGGMWVDEFRALPPSERFFAGGDKSIRGYDYQDLGPINSSGSVIGGRYLGVMSFELEKYFTDSWGAAAFVDSGNAFGGPGENTGLKTGAGLGLRWRSPVGPVRVDLAHPLDDDDTLFKLHLRIGPDF